MDIEIKTWLYDMKQAIEEIEILLEIKAKHKYFFTRSDYFRQHFIH